MDAELTETIVEILARRLDALGSLEEIADIETLLWSEKNYYVRRARHNDATWEQIGAALGMSKQAAHKRFSVA